MWWLGFRSGPDSGGGVSGGQESGDMFPKLSSKKKRRLRGVGAGKKGWQNYVLPPPAKFQKKLNLQYGSKTILSSYPI
jgi:hypothetical protein